MKLFSLLFFFLTFSSSSLQAAEVFFNDVYAGVGTSYGLNTNSITISAATKLSGKDFSFESLNPADASFTGSDLDGYFKYIDAAGNAVSIRGKVTRPDANGASATSVYFAATDLTGNATGDAYLFIFPGAESTFPGTGSISTNSSPVKDALNTLLTLPRITNDNTVLNSFSSCTGVVSAEQSFSLSASYLTADIIISAPTGYEVSLTSGSGFSNSLTIPYGSGTINTTSIYVRLSSSATNGAGGDITVSSTGAATRYKITGSATVSSGISISVTPSSATIISGASHSLTASGASTYSWSPSTALSSTTGATVSANPTSTITYTVTGTSSGGCTGTADVTITVTDALGTLSYSQGGTTSSSYTFTKGTPITPVIVSITSGTPISYSISPALPAGLSFNPATGEISGTPTVFTGEVTYTISATDGVNTVTTDVKITINDAAPSGLSYSTPNVFTNGTAITDLNPTVSGGAVDSYSISPSLPAGLSLNTTTGVISGTPTALSVATSYTVTATNTGGSTTATLSIEVIDAAPSGLSYTTPNVYTKGTAITALNPTVSGGAVVSYSVSPSLPAGLSLNSTTGVISGTPTALSVATTYTVTATNTGGSTTATLSITVNDVAPSGLSYTTPNVYTKGTAITALNPTVSGGAVVSYSVSPSLPAGLSLNTTTGVISGTPTALSVATSYTVTATNTGGSTTATLSIAVIDAAPSGLSYTTPNVYTKGTAITALNPTVSGGAVVSYSIAPTLPAGLSLNTTTGVISGTPTAVSAATSYTVTATNTGGSTTATLSITVNDAAPSGLNYTTPNTLYKGLAMTALNPTVSGGAVVSYSISPALSAGLSLNPTTGVISGTPTAMAAKVTYVITATNTGGSTSKSVDITVVDQPPLNLGYNPNPINTKRGITVVNSVPTSSGGTVISYSISPALPLGMSFNTTTGVISGTPTWDASPTTVYTIVATNSGGTASTTVTLNVSDDYALVVNNVITPNGDGYNDVWKIGNIAAYPDNEVWIYDRYGKLIYNRKNYNNEFNGKINGVALKTDTYYYVFKMNYPGVPVKKGYFTVVN